ncbi:unnamed protein product [Rotaria sp. Silwood1]|nr:unnamed protein product [Rotaria sp. Silwood1]
MNMYTFLLFLLFAIAKAVDAYIRLERRVPDQIRLTFAGNNAVNVGWHSSPPALGNRSQAVNIATYGDLGVDGLLGTLINGVCLFERALRALQQILPSVDFFLHHGDICYADDTPLLLFGKPYEEAMDDCQRAMMKITSTRFYMTAVLTYSKITNEFLQTEEFKREIVLVYKQLRSLCLELIYIHTHTYSTNMSTSSSISDTVDKVYDRLKNGCLISILFELKNLIKDMIEHEDIIIYKNENDILSNNTNTILPSPSMATINSYTSAYDDVNLLIVPSTPPV